MAVSEYEVENLFIERLGTIGYQFIQIEGLCGSQEKL